ncbi:hypothetical protein [Helicobacter equorum]|uniref:HD domain-containing protein n=1 Tax=Helicobacter equorum TaxID=361872 RepID=A0A3D8IMM1_9HELI|nr:hypothetical protein [Helicobacter equorum]RDU66452.1 hypothetical protein CQA54_07060 [Helicobacter equorum]
MIFFRKKYSIIEMLYQNIKLLREINKARKEREFVKHFENTHEAHQFQDSRVTILFEKYRNRFKDRQLEPLIAYLMRDMEFCNFESSSSVPSIYETQYIRYKNRYDKLRDINLLSHTIRVFIKALELETNMPDRFMEQIALLTLAHDFGKNKKIYSLVASEGSREAHNHISALYLKIVMQRIQNYSDEFINSMCDSIYNHHSNNRIQQIAVPNSTYGQKEDLSLSFVENEFIKYLNICDHAARTEELRIIEQKILETESNKFKEWKGIK